jgi:tetratricopeptide (TPR) repeat protein
MAMIEILDQETETQRQYDRLIVALEASQGKLDLLIAVCEDRNLQAQIIDQYEQALRQQQIPCWRVFIRYQQPSLRLALETLIAQKPQLQQGESGMVTVLGIDSLIPVRLGAAQSQREQFMGYLQWTREAFRQFSFPIVVWVTEEVVGQMAEQSPDFWSWRGGVFWFGVTPGKRSRVNRFLRPPVDPSPRMPAQSEALVALLQQIEALEQQPPDRVLEQLTDLYQQLGELYAKRFESEQNRQFAIQVYKRVIQLQTQLGQQEPLAKNWERLGDLYFERRHDAQQAAIAYNEALGLYRQVGDRLGEANTLKAIADVQQFLDQLQEAWRN